MWTALFFIFFFNKNNIISLNKRHSNYISTKSKEIISIFLKFETLFLPSNKTCYIFPEYSKFEYSKIENQTRLYYLYTDATVYLFFFI